MKSYYQLEKKRIRKKLVPLYEIVNRLDEKNYQQLIKSNKKEADAYEKNR